jgi:hypothetical protein
METNMNRLRLVVSVALQDTGEATRSLEIVRGLRENIPLGYALEIIFLSYGSKFESKIIEEAINELQPDFIMHGFWSFASIARRMLKILKLTLKSLDY